VTGRRIFEISSRWSLGLSGSRFLGMRRGGLLGLNFRRRVNNFGRLLGLDGGRFLRVTDGRIFDLSSRRSLGLDRGCFLAMSCRGLLGLKRGRLLYVAGSRLVEGRRRRGNWRCIGSAP
jgi:hypothetical protein